MRLLNLVLLLLNKNLVSLKINGSGGIIKEKLKNKVRKRFRNIHLSKIILYKNPNEFCSVYIERVNPDHVGVLWGKRKKSLNKGSHYIKWGKVYFSALPVMVGLSITSYISLFALCQVVFGVCMVTPLVYMLYFLPFRLGCDNKCQMC